jgi:ribosomal protein S14
METQRHNHVRVEKVRENRVVLKVYTRCSDCGNEQLDELLDQLEASLRVAVFRRTGRRCYRCSQKLVSTSGSSG